MSLNKKTSLRDKYKKLRLKIPAEVKKHNDKNIYLNILNLTEFFSASTVLCFVSSDNEVDTKKLIEHSLKAGKTVAVPKCLDSSGNMDFFIIDSLKALSPDSFGILEPDILKCKKLKDLKGAVCIVPGLVFDKKGYRIGYGKGYYDRFLEKNNCLKIGLCYKDFIADTLPYESYDISVDYIVTEKGVIKTENDC